MKTSKGQIELFPEVFPVKETKREKAARQAVDSESKRAAVYNNDNH